MVTIQGRVSMHGKKGEKTKKKRKEAGWRRTLTVGTKKGVEEGGGRRGGPLAAPLYCGRFFRMAFTSSATAVRANSNWSCRETVK